MPTFAAAAPPQTAPASEVSGETIALLRVARRRLGLQTFVELLAMMACGVAAGILASAVLVKLSLFLTCAVLLPSAISLGLTVARRWPTLAQTAATLDTRAGARDRFSTALEFSARPALTPLETLALAECACFARDFPVRQWTPFRLPWIARWIPLPLAGLALLSWGAFAPHRRAPIALDAAVALRADSLQKIADALRKTDSPSPDAAKLAEAMEKAAKRLKTDAPSDADHLKTALREMSSLEAMLNALKAAKTDKVSDAELAALAAALAANEAAKPASDALRKGDLEAAASQLEKLLEQLKQRGDPNGALQQLAQSMQEQAAKLTEEQKNELARQMQAAAQGAQAGQAGLSQQAMQRLADLLRQAGRNGAGGQSSEQKGGGAGRSMTEQELQSLLDALADMKNGLRPGDNTGGNPNNGQPGGDPSMALVESFSKNTGPSAGKMPSGQPGSDHDAGHSDNLFAKDAPSAVKPQGPATRLSGAPGEGESMQQFLSAASDASRATRAYRDNYQRLAPSAQNAVEQENIPLGARSYVRRYFENIRPTE